MSYGSTDIHASPAMLKRGRCRSPGVNSKMSSSATPGTRCIVYLRRCLAIQLQKVGMFPSTGGGGGGGSGGNSGTSCLNSNNFDTTLERDAPLYWMYDSGYLIFQGFLDANLKCFWNGALMEAMKVLEFQGYIAPGVLLVTGSPCALEVVRAAWARNVLKPPNNYVINVVGDVEDCLVEPISQGQFTPLPEALCWIILDMTASGQAAVMESICLTLEAAFPDMQKPSEQLVYDTLAKLMAEKKLYQTSNGYFVMTPDKMRLSGLTNNAKNEYNDSFIGGHKKQILLTPEEAAVMIHGEIETVRDGNVTHQAIQTNLADVICGGNANDKILYPRMPSRIRSGYSTERLERRHSLRLFGHGRRSQSLQRTGSVRHNVSDKSGDRVQTSKDLASPDDASSRKHNSLFSRLFRRSGRMRREGSPSPVSRPTFSAQFPPAEWFNRGVTHLHSVGTQTTYLAPSTDTLPKRSFDYDFDDVSLQDLQQRRHISAFGTPRMIRRTPHSATLPRRSLKKSSLYNISCDKETISRISSQNSVVPTNASSSNDTCNNNNNNNHNNNSNTPPTSSHSSITSAKTVISKEHHSKRSSPIHKSAMSSASSGYNSLPRSVRSAKSPGRGYGGGGGGGGGGSANVNPKLKAKTKAERSMAGALPPPLPQAENSITFHVSAKSSTGYEGDAAAHLVSPKTETSATTMTTTINSGNKTKIFLQQHNAPIRSLITFENSVNDEDDKADNIVIVNQQPQQHQQQQQQQQHQLYEAKENRKPVRPTSLYAAEQNNNNLNKSTNKLLENQLIKMKFPSTETIQLEEKSLEGVPANNKSNVNVNNVRDDISTCKNLVGLKNANLYGFSSETELNNVKNYLLNQSANVDKISNFKNKNILANNVDRDESKFRDCFISEPASPIVEHHVHQKLNDLKNSNEMTKVENELDASNLADDDHHLRKYPDFPSLSDLSLRFTSLAAQSILKGVSYNSVDTLVEVNMAAEKKRNCEMSISTDLGVV